MDGILARLDARVAPGRFTVVTRLDEEFRSALGGTVRDLMGAIGNASGLPSVAVPNDIGYRGLPTSLRLMGRAFAEERDPGGRAGLPVTDRPALPSPAAGLWPGPAGRRLPGPAQGSAVGARRVSLRSA